MMCKIINNLHTKTFIQVALVFTLSPYMTNAEDNLDTITNKQTPLHIATYKGDKTSVISLIRSNTHINVEDRSGWTPLHVAIYREHEDIARILLTHGADSNRTDNIGQTPLYVAVYKGYYNMAHLLIQHGAKVNITDDTGWTPLHLAILQGKKNIVQLLIAHGADVNKKTETGWTPLDIAKYKDHTDLINLLIEKGADENKTDKGSQTPHQTSTAHITKDRFITSTIRDESKYSNKNNLTEPLIETTEEYLREKLQFKQGEIEHLKRQNPQAFSNFVYYQISLTMKELERSVQVSKEEFKTLTMQNFSALVNTKAGGLRRIISFMEGYIDKDEIKARLMQDPQTLSNRQIQALRKVMPFIDSYMEVDADKGTDETTIPLHWLLFAKNAEQILPVIEGYGDEATLMTKHDNYRTPFHWAFYEDRQKFTAFFKGEDINLSECPNALSN